MKLSFFSQKLTPWAFLSCAILVVVLIATVVFASPPSTPYAPGATLDPSCSPGDTNCTVYSPLTTTLTATTTMTMNNFPLNFNSGTLYIDSLNSRVGIGTTNPESKVHIIGTKTLTGNLFPLIITDDTALAAGVGGGINFYGRYTAGSYTTAGSMDTYKENATDGDYGFGYRFFTRQNGVSLVQERLRITSSGNVGIGTAGPGSRLTVADTFTAAEIAVLNTAGTKMVGLSSTFSEGDLSIYNSAAAKKVFLTAYGDSYILQGNVGIGTAGPASRLHVTGSADDGTGAITLGTSDIVNGYINTADGIYFNIDSNNNSNSNNFVFAANRSGRAAGTELMRIQETGNVGIGTNETLISRFHVKGSASVAAEDTVNKLSADGTFDTSTNWTPGATWTIGTSKALHITGTATLSGTTTVVSTNLYAVNFTVADVTTGSMTVQLGAYDSGITISTSGAKTVYIFALATNAALTFTPTNTFNGSVDNVTIHQMIRSTPDGIIQASDDTNSNAGMIEIRAIGALKYSVATGYHAGQFNTTGNVTAFGYEAAQNNVTGIITAIGHEAGNYNTTGNATLVGYGAGYNNTTGTIVAIGQNAGYDNTSGNLVSVGYLAGQHNTTGILTAVGNNAARQNTTGDITAIGASAGLNNTTGKSTLIGGYAGYYNTGGNLTAVGESSGYYNTTGSLLALGHFAGRRMDLGGYDPVTDTYAILIGQEASRSVVSATALTNYIGIGYQARVSKSNQVVLGNSNITETLLYGNVGIGTTTPGTSLSLGDTGANTINISATATSTFGSGLDIKTGCFAINGTCVGGGTSGITTLGALNQGQTGSSQTLATSSDTNIGLQIVSSGNSHTFTSQWIGTLAAGRGGTGIGTPSAAGVMLGSYAGGAWQQLATSSLGLSTTNIIEGTNLFYTDAKVNTYIHGSSTIPKTYTANSFTGLQTLNGGLTIGALNGPLHANNGVVAATTSVGVVYGGTGVSTFGQGWLHSSGGTTALTSSTSPTVNYITATSTTATSTFSGGFTAGNNAGLVINQTAPANSLYINSAGNVGIGTMVPAAVLQVGVGTPYTAIGQVDIWQASKPDDSVGNINIYADNAATINTGGSIAFGGNRLTGNPYIFGKVAGRSESGSGWAGYLQFLTTAAGAGIFERMRIDSTGNVGIGTTTPVYKLTVNSTNATDNLFQVA
ncbi:MAG: hypothetical protein WC587_02330, partial [Candidatus Paceibacterota bacterium]